MAKNFVLLFLTSSTLFARSQSIAGRETPSLIEIPEEVQSEIINSDELFDSTLLQRERRLGFGASSSLKSASSDHNRRSLNAARNSETQSSTHCDQDLIDQKYQNYYKQHMEGQPHIKDYKPDLVSELLKSLREMSSHYFSSWTQSANFLKPGFTMEARISRPTAIYDYLKNHAAYGNCLFSHEKVRKKAENCENQKIDIKNRHNADYDYSCFYKYLLAIQEIDITDVVSGRLFKYAIEEDDYLVIPGSGRKGPCGRGQAQSGHDDDQMSMGSRNRMLNDENLLPELDQNETDLVRNFCLKKGHPFESDLLFMNFTTNGLKDGVKNFGEDAIDSNSTSNFKLSFSICASLPVYANRMNNYLIPNAKVGEFLQTISLNQYHGEGMNQLRVVVQYGNLRGLFNSAEFLQETFKKDVNSVPLQEEPNKWWLDEKLWEIAQNYSVTDANFDCFKPWKDSSKTDEDELTSSAVLESECETTYRTKSDVECLQHYLEENINYEFSAIRKLPLTVNFIKFDKSSLVLLLSLNVSCLALGLLMLLVRWDEIDYAGILALVIQSVRGNASSEKPKTA